MSGIRDVGRICFIEGRLELFYALKATKSRRRSNFEGPILEFGPQNRSFGTKIPRFDTKVQA